MSINYTPRTWVVSELVTAAEMNTEIRDALTGIQAAWTSYTPTWTSLGTAPALGNGTLAGAYSQYGKTILFTIKLTAGSTTTYGTLAYRFNIPTTAGGTDHIASGFIGDSSVGAAGYSAPVIGLISSGSQAMAMYAGNVTASQAVSNTTPQTFANGDRIWASGTYQSA